LTHIDTHLSEAVELLHWSRGPRWTASVFWCLY